MALVQPIRGMHDFLPPEARRLSQLMERGYRLAERYGFQEIRTPILERVEVFSRPLGESSDIVGKEMYLFEDRGGDKLALRPEGTASVVRAFLSNGLTGDLPLKVCYAGPMFRYERPQKGRYRQFHQMGVENLGTTSPWEDAEGILLAAQYLDSVGVSAHLEINTLGDEESRVAYRSALVAYFEKRRDALSELSKKRLSLNPLRILDSKEPEDRELIREAPSLDAHLTEEAQEFFALVREALSAFGVSCVYNPRIVRGLDYYTHTVFEFLPASGEGSALLAGGRYDHLVELMGGPKIPGFGWAAGLERLLSVAHMPEEAPSPVAVLAVGPFEEKAYTCARLLRDQGHAVQVFCGKKLSKLLGRADKAGAFYAGIIGEEEVASGCVLVKNLKDGAQERVPFSSISAFFSSER